MASSDLDLSLKEDRLFVRIKMEGPTHTFGTGKVGFLYRNGFLWRGREWALKFQAFMMEMETETTLGMLGGVYRSERLARIAESKLTVAQLGDKLIQIRNRCLAREERQAAGWDLIGVSDGLEGYFDLNAIRDLPRGKIGSFASCNLRVDGVLYLAQFHLFEQQGTSSKPTAWAKSSGPSAGLPSLGKRR